MHYSRWDNKGFEIDVSVLVKEALRHVHNNCVRLENFEYGNYRATGDVVDSDTDWIKVSAAPSGDIVDITVIRFTQELKVVWVRTYFNRQLQRR